MMLTQTSPSSSSILTSGPGGAASGAGGGHGGSRFMAALSAPETREWSAIGMDYWRTALKEGDDVRLNIRGGWVEAIVIAASGDDLQVKPKSPADGTRAIDVRRSSTKLERHSSESERAAARPPRPFRRTLHGETAALADSEGGRLASSSFGSGFRNLGFDQGPATSESFASTRRPGPMDVLGSGRNPSRDPISESPFTYNQAFDHGRYARRYAEATRTARPAGGFGPRDRSRWTAGLGASGGFTVSIPIAWLHGDEPDDSTPSDYSDDSDYESPLPLPERVVIEPEQLLSTVQAAASSGRGQNVLSASAPTFIPTVAPPTRSDAAAPAATAGPIRVTAPPAVPAPPAGAGPLQQTASNPLAPPAAGGDEPAPSEALATEDVCEELACVACMSEKKCFLMVPCMHVCVCQKCSEHPLVIQNGCPICRAVVSGMAKVYL